MAQNIFERYEVKYKMSKEDYKQLLQHMQKHMQIDKFKRHTIRNVYFDTDDYRIIRHSIEKPLYKEKLRIRMYGEPSEDKIVFVELKKKFKGIVYKRRVDMKYSDAISYFWNDDKSLENTQILKEVDYFIKCNEGIKPKTYIEYEREAFFSQEDNDFRITFDFNLKYRDIDVDLNSSEQDLSVIDEDIVLMEVKTVSGMPFWLIEFLNEKHIYKQSFSKYATAYSKFILPNFLQLIRRTVND
ncbi:MAG: polyphosphate polymerase domain-containing protein [Clostridia bacterium]